MVTAQDGGKFVSVAHLSPLPPGNAPGTHFFDYQFGEEIILKISWVSLMLESS